MHFKSAMAQRRTHFNHHPRMLISGHISCLEVPFSNYSYLFIILHARKCPGVPEHFTMMLFGHDVRVRGAILGTTRKVANTNARPALPRSCAPHGPQYIMLEVIDPITPQKGRLIAGNVRAKTAMWCAQKARDSEKVQLQVVTSCTEDVEFYTRSR